MQSDRRDLHAALLLCMQREAYPVSEKGVCAGWVMMGVRAFFNKTLTSFKQLTNDFFHLAPLTTNQRAFLDGVELFQQPEKHAAWFVKPVSALKPEYITELTSAHYIEQCGGLSALKSVINLYSRLDLMRHLFLLESKVRAANKPFAVTIATMTHRIAICYEPEKKIWLAFDINQWPISQFKSLEAPVFFKWLVFAFNESFPLVLTQRYYCLKRDKAAFKALLEEKNKLLIKNIHPDIAALAVRHGEVPTLVQLKAAGLAVNEPLSDGWLPVMLAAESGELDTLRWLKAQGANLNAQLQNGGNAFFVAAQLGHVEVVRWLLSEKVNSEQSVTLFKPEWLQFAKQHDAYQAMSTLLQSKTTPDNASFSISPYEIAQVLGRKEVVNLIAQSRLGLFAPAEAPLTKKERPRMA